MSTDERPDPLQSLWQSQEVEPVKISLDDIRKKADAFGRTIHQRNMREWVISALLVPLFGWMAYEAQGAPLFRLACLLIVAGIVYIAWRLARDARTTPPPPLEASTAEHLAAHRANLEKQRDLLLSVPRWYIGPIVPGMVLFYVGTALEMPARAGAVRWVTVAVGLSGTAAVFAFLIWVNRLAARKLQA
jgi:hypothetical protein